MKIKLRTIINSAPVLGSIYKQKISGNVAYKIRTIIKAVSSEMSDYDEVRLKLLSEHGTLNEEDNKYEFESPEKEKEFIKQMEEVLDNEVELPDKKLNKWDVEKIPLISGEELEAIEWFIEE